MPPEQVGQGSFGFSGAELAPVPRHFEPEQKIAISSMIKHIADVRNIDPGTTTERDVRVMSPGQIESGLYLPEGARDSKQQHARGGVIFPPAQYADLTISPARVASKAVNKVWRDHEHAADKSIVEAMAQEEADKALKNHLGRLQNLASALSDQEEFLDIITRELGGARGTGYYAHYPAIDLRMKVAGAETAIFDALEVAAITHSWDRDKYSRAKRALSYQLFGGHENRFKNWKAYASMAKTYAYRRRKIIENSEKPIVSELKKYQPVADNEA